MLGPSLRLTLVLKVIGISPAFELTDGVNVAMVTGSSVLVGSGVDVVPEITDRGVATSEVVRVGVDEAIGSAVGNGDITAM